MNATTNYSPLRLTFISLSFCLIVSACDDDVLPTSENAPPTVNLVYSAGRYQLEDLIEQFNASNVVGVMQLYKRNFEILRQSIPEVSPWEPRTFESSSGYATLYNISDETLTSAGIVTVNDVLFKEYQTGTYQDWNLAGETKLSLNFGAGTNVIFLQGSDVIPRHTSTVSFAAAPSVTNVIRGQQVSRSADFTVEWAGSGVGHTEVGIDAGNAIRNPQAGQISGIVRFVDNSGSTTLSGSSLQDLPNGIVEVYVTQFDPVAIHLPNGQQVYVVGVSSHEISIELID